jgi:predicted MFS family arabinose efflux permease
MAMDLNFDADEKIDEEREDDKDKEVKKAERKAKREAKDKAKRPILWALMICAVIANTSYLNAVALLPVYIANNFGDKINDTMIGILLAGYSIGFIIAAPCVGTSLSKIGRRKAILIGMLLMALATCLFACAAYFTDPWVFYSISLLGRLG